MNRGSAFDLDRIGSGLPVAAALPDLLQALAAHRVAVVQAPPGTGKTTLVPPALAELPVAGRVVVTQPRRVAARAAARRLAALAGVRLGEEVGFTVRGESRRSARTRVEFCTTGVLLRRLLTDPELPGVGAVVLDEVHERALESDLAVGMLRELLELREDLLLVAMSATLMTQRFAEILGTQENPAPVVAVQDQLFPLMVEWRPPPAGVRTLDARGVTREFCGHLAASTAAALDRHPGDALVFVPGAWEVDQVCAALRARLGDGIAVLPLHGRLPSREQDAALSLGAGRRVVVATAVAETSLTVPGVSIVVDSGLSRQPRFDAARELSGLVTVSASRATAIQRAGRAARLGPGLVVRCWPEDAWARAAPADPPQIASADLTSAMLDLACWGTPRGTGLALPDQPPPAAVDRAEETLRGLGAIDADGTPTPLGRRLVRIPADPRLARALLEGAPRIGARRCAEVVAMLAAEDLGREVDLTKRWRGLRSGQMPQAGAWSEQVQRLLGFLDSDSPRGAATEHRGIGDDQAVGWVVALAHPQRLARARGSAGAYLLVSGSGAELPSGSPLREHSWLAVAELGRTAGSAVIRAAVPIEESLALTAGAGLIRQDDEVSWAEGRLTGRRVRRLGAIELAATAIRPDPAQGRVAVAAALRSKGLRLLPWSRAAVTLRNRLALLHRVFDDWPAMDDAALLTRLEDWLGPELESLAAGARQGSIDTAAALRRLLDWRQAARLDELAPGTVEVPSGSRIRLDYPDHDDPGTGVRVAVKLQETFGLAASPRIAEGRVPLVFELLSPAGRPLAITADLANFWNEVYPQVRAENRGRYSKHPWPEDPWTAPARRGTSRQGR